MTFCGMKKKRLVAKETLKRSKIEGGLGLHDISDLLLAQNVKIIYKIIQDKEETWNQIGKHYLKL